MTKNDKNLIRGIGLTVIAIVFLTSILNPAYTEQKEKEQKEEDKFFECLRDRYTKVCEMPDHMRKRNEQ